MVECQRIKKLDKLGNMKINISREGFVKGGYP